MQNLIIGIIVLGITIAVYHFVFRKDDQPLLENDAKRFAGLLVAEINLYNNYKVQRGIKNNNLYESLKDEIKEARSKYKKRITDENFAICFDDALTEILASGDKNKLGLITTSYK